MKEDNKNVYFFWIRGGLKLDNLLTIRSFRAMGHNPIIYSYKPDITTECEVRDANEIMGENEGFLYKNLHPNMELGGWGDKLRARMLYTLGGWHSDLDITCLKPLDFDSEWVFRPHDVGLVPNLIKVPKQSKFAEYYIENTNKLNADNKDWEGSFSFLINYVKENNLEQYIQDEKLFGKDNWNFWKYMIFEPNSEPNPERMAIHWTSSTGREHNWTNYVKDSYFEKLLKQYQLI